MLSESRQKEMLQDPLRGILSAMAHFSQLAISNVDDRWTQLLLIYAVADVKAVAVEIVWLLLAVSIAVPLVVNVQPDC